MGSVLVAAVRANAVLDVVVDDEIQFLVREAVVLRQNRVDLINDGLDLPAKNSS